MKHLYVPEMKEFPTPKKKNQNKSPRYNYIV